MRFMRWGGKTDSPAQWWDESQIAQGRYEALVAVIEGLDLVEYMRGGGVAQWLTGDGVDAFWSDLGAARAVRAKEAAKKAADAKEERMYAAARRIAEIAGTEPPYRDTGGGKEGAPGPQGPAGPAGADGACECDGCNPKVSSGPAGYTGGVMSGLIQVMNEAGKFEGMTQADVDRMVAKIKNGGKK